MTVNDKINEIREKLRNFPSINNFEVSLIPISDDTIEFEMIGRRNIVDMPDKKMYQNNDYFYRKRKTININEDFKIE